MRPVISYDDISAPSPDDNIIPHDEDTTHAEAGGGPAQPTDSRLGPQFPSSSAQAPPTKRRRTNQPSSSRSQQHAGNKQPQRHWDDSGPGGATRMNYGGDEEDGEDVGEEEEDEDEEDEESRQLTHEEIWDDSALIDAWNSASAEYEAYHGKGDKSWKTDSVKKSPLWYNVPPEPSKKTKGKEKARPTTNGTGPFIPEIPALLVASNEEADSQPLDFNTYIPTHDASLAPPHPPDVPGPDYAQYFLPPLQGPMVSQDEAFQRAMSAMYWGGYWTAVYHYQRQGGQPTLHNENVEGEDQDMQDEAEDENFVSTQR
ncbi:hypothetical protein EIP91_006972 [Steccherinum ochraceum]|uniref:Survival Motor Neuron Gemin2-binding domain-containing protein n=1 Tax=Steccherinum ochraceum TaxID=92696 RepID=A0A4R0R7G4_9APHY|nr:hypothetical protein EIP91_006972 [Steccherinum ochraceum]